MLRTLPTMLVLAVVLAGCSSGLPTPTPPLYITNDYAISEDDHVAIGFDALETATVELSVSFSGRQVAFDVFVMTPAQLEAWPDGQFSTYGDCEWTVREDTVDNLVCEVRAGSYFLVLENGNSGDVNPPTNGINDKVEVTARIWVSR